MQAGAPGTFEEEMESLLDRERRALRRLWTLAFLLLVGLILVIPFLLLLGTIGWGAVALAILVAFLTLQGGFGDYRAAHEAVVRRVARR